MYHYTSDILPDVISVSSKLAYYYHLNLWLLNYPYLSYDITEKCHITMRYTIVREKKYIGQWVRCNYEKYIAKNIGSIYPLVILIIQFIAFINYIEEIHRQEMSLLSNNSSCQSQELSGLFISLLSIPSYV